MELDERFGNIDSAIRRRSKNTIAVKKLISLKHLRGFKKIKDIKKIYKWEKELGAGQFGTVHQAIHLQTETICAVKVIHKSKVAEAEVY